ncbi:MAG: hypothetical protein ACI9SI_001794 [Polaribacter sp.]|jgi:hypothetical protein
MRSKKLFLLLLLIPLFAFSAHKYYLSLTQIEYNSTSKSVEVIINVFVDDIETALNDIHKKNFELNTKDEITDVDSYFFKYVQNHLKFKIDDTTVNYSFIGKEYDGNVVFFYLEIKDIQSVTKIEVDNTILLEHFPKQQNLVKSKVNKKHKSIMLTKKKPVGILKY